jgi:hypothetical protein
VNLSAKPGETVVHLILQDHSLIICNDTGVFILCSTCGGLKNMFYHKENVDLPWQATCRCHSNGLIHPVHGYAIAPNLGGDTSPLPHPEPEAERPAFVYDQGLQHFTMHPAQPNVTRLVDVDRKEFGGNTIA